MVQWSGDLWVAVRIGEGVWGCTIGQCSVSVSVSEEGLREGAQVGGGDLHQQVAIFPASFSIANWQPMIRVNGLPRTRIKITRLWEFWDSHNCED